MQKYMIIYLQYNQIYNDDPLTWDEIMSFCSDWDKNLFLESLCKVNILLWASTFNTGILVDINLQQKLIYTFFTPNEANTILDIAKKNNSILVHRQQILLLIKSLLLSTPKTISKVKTPTENIHEVGKVLLSINQLIENDTTSKIELPEEVKKERRRRFMARNWYFNYNYMNKYRSRIARSIIIWNHIPKTKQGKESLSHLKLKIDKEFKQQTSLTINEYIGLGMSLLSTYITLNITIVKPKDFLINKENYFSQIKLDNKKTRKIFEQFILDSNTYSKQNKDFIKNHLDNKDNWDYNFLPLEDKPLLYINNDFIIPISNHKPSTTLFSYFCW